MIKKLLHFFGIHDWSKWGHPENSNFTDNWSGKKFKVSIQKRHCLICKKIETSEI